MSVLANGEKHEADPIVGAEGLHSRTRYLLFNAPKPYSTGNSCYRFIIDVSEICNDKDCLQMDPMDTSCRIIISETKRVVIYSCRNGGLLNFVCMHQDNATEPRDDWNTESTTEALVESFSDFGAPVFNCLKKARNVKYWQMQQRPPIPSWIKAKVCLVGDAAHPMLPHQGQGGGQAIEDGAALGPLFRLGATPSQVPEVLKLYQQVRYHQVSTIEELSRSQIAGKHILDPKIVQDYVFSHDVVEYAKYNRASQMIL